MGIVHITKLNSPTGVSISGCGYRVFCIGRLPDGMGNVSGHGADDLTEEAKEHILFVKPDCTAFNGFEAYAGSQRHLSVTGQWLPEYPTELDKRSREIAEIVAPFLRRPQEQPPTKTTSGRLLSEKRIHLGCGWRQEEATISLDDFRRRVSILDVIDTTGFTDEGDGQLVGANPIIGSATGRNLSVDPSRGIWINFHNGLERGGTVVDWLACEAGIIEWEDAGRGSLNREVIKQVLDYAVDCGYIAEDEAFPSRKK